jgi:hypothetical protein
MDNIKKRLYFLKSNLTTMWYSYELKKIKEEIRILEIIVKASEWEELSGE